MSKKKESINLVKMGLKKMSFMITVCHCWANLMRPNGDLRNRLFDPTLLILYTLLQIENKEPWCSVCEVGGGGGGTGYLYLY